MALRLSCIQIQNIEDAKGLIEGIQHDGFAIIGALKSNFVQISDKDFSLFSGTPVSYNLFQTLMTVGVRKKDAGYFCT